MGDSGMTARKYTAILMHEGPLYQACDSPPPLSGGLPSICQAHQEVQVAGWQAGITSMNVLPPELAHR
jgi:hypothetical protein